MKQKKSAPKTTTSVEEAFLVGTLQIEASPQEQEALKKARELVLKKTSCVKEIDAILEKYGATIGVNPNSPISRPEVVVSIL
jgi:hypothetical protein